MNILACFIGIIAGYGAVLFTWLIHTIDHFAIGSVMNLVSQDPRYRLLIIFVPTVGLLLVAWFTRRFAPEAQGHGVPEVIKAVARQDGIIRPRVSLVKILASAFCIGTGGSVGREGPIVQIGSSLGSSTGQFFKLSAENIKTLVACGAAGGISATFNAPLAGVMFASEVILGSFAVRNLTPIVIASVLAGVVQLQAGEHGLSPAFRQLDYQYIGNWHELPSYFTLGLVCGLAAVSFTKFLYRTEDFFDQRLKKWWKIALVAGIILGMIGAVYPSVPPAQSQSEKMQSREYGGPPPPVFGVGYPVVDNVLHLVVTGESADKPKLESSQVDRRVLLTQEKILPHLL